MPPAGKYTVVDANNTIEVALKKIGQTSVSGTARDENDVALSGATVVVSQQLNGKFSKIVSTTTNSNGHFSVEAYNDSSMVIVSYPDYMDYVVVKSNFDNGSDLGVITLQPITGARITVNMTYTKSVSAGETPVTENTYPDYRNVDYNLFNVTKNSEITQFTVQYPEIILLEHVDAGDEIRITAASRVNDFEQIRGVATIDSELRANVHLNILQRGYITANHIGDANAQNTGILYDGEGKLLGQFDYINGVLTSSGLPDGSYTLVSMSNSRFFNSALYLSALQSIGLAPGIDYILQQTTVRSGEVTRVNVPAIPALDESKLYYTGDKTLFSVNRTSVIAGNFLALRAQVDFKEDYANRVGNIKLIFDIPEHCHLVENTISINNFQENYSLVGNRIIVPLTNYSDIVRFTVIPLQGGDYAPNAFIEFDFEGKTIMQPIGAAVFKVENINIFVTQLTPRKDISVRGVSQARSEIWIYDNGVLIGQTKALASGEWSLKCNLHNPTELSYHHIYAKIITPRDLTLKTETKQAIHDINAIIPEKVSLLNNGQTLVFDFLNLPAKGFSYVYTPPTNNFSFAIEFTNNAPNLISNVILHVLTTSGKTEALSASYDPVKRVWIAAGIFDIYRLPVNVSVSYVISNYSQKITKEITTIIVYLPPSAIPIIDPSGYVFEAVPSNRLPGVTATIYFKTMEENIYGDMEEVIAFWEAEDFGQENPLLTDEDGEYGWDVPAGMWQVKFEKEGYQTVYSDWLPVPPPQLEVNMYKVQPVQPAICDVQGYENGIVIQFDKYMQPKDMTVDFITVTRNGTNETGAIEFLDYETNHLNDKSFVSRVRFLPNVPFSVSDEVFLTVKGSVKSYADISMSDDFSVRVEILKDLQE